MKAKTTDPFNGVSKSDYKWGLILASVGMVGRSAILISLSAQAVTICRSPFDLWLVGMVSVAVAVVIGSVNTLTALIIQRGLKTQDNRFRTVFVFIEVITSMVLGVIGAAQAWSAISGKFEILSSLWLPSVRF